VFTACFADDLMSLLDAGMHSDHAGVIIDSDAMFSENMFGYSALRGRAAMRSRAGTWFASIFRLNSSQWLNCCISLKLSRFMNIYQLEISCRNIRRVFC
jgi:hypothetical protein